MNKNSTIKKKKYAKGFTLVEMLVSLSLFTFVVLAVISSLLIVNNSSKRVQSMKVVMDNINFAVESMSRNIKAGSNITCNSLNECPISGYPGSSLRFNELNPNTSIQQIEYSLNSNTGSIERRENDGTWSSPIAVTAPEVKVSSLGFFLENDATEQPKVSVFINGYALVGAQQIPFSIQTAVSSRVSK